MFTGIVEDVGAGYIAQRERKMRGNYALLIHFRMVAGLNRGRESICKRLLPHSL